MTYTQQIKIGQRWRSRDRREPARIVTVIAVDSRVNEPGNNGFVTIKFARRSHIRAQNLHARYELIG